ncbi:FlaA1/EpsC-like NDP-sugar epimerase [Litoreibacter ponti]|uniref:FlaA1/EpsC-like NDP-sugar epimerase n=1 Tax=Litoreibacter ponti TaxID=1510457 RepID=A0A2T6BPX9_9RHOB|nr:nucleoside-diphosphate sugar epimerase/dehydratase [Litoreibacter ponti]PTX58096.1 FlaA1/EpsC-like NDP-sugar epimerase [Litoreibacter ponti]
MFDFFISLSSGFRRAILLSIDVISIAVSVVFAFAILEGSVWPTAALSQSGLLILTITLLSVPVLMLVGTNRVKLSAFEIYDVNLGLFAATAMAAITGVLAVLNGVPDAFQLAMVTAVAFMGVHVTGRLVGRHILRRRLTDGEGRIPVAIFGAGAAGVQLLAALRKDLYMRPVTFVDDNPALQSMTVSGMKVRSRSDLERMISRGRVQRILLAMPSMNEVKLRRVTQELSSLGTEVHALPSYTELVEGKGLAGSLRPVTADMLLGRDKVDLQTPEMARAYAGRRVLITGAGGSIGSELCRQILACRPQRLTLLDHSEYALYTIARELQPLADAAGIELTARLGSVCDKARMQHVIAESEIDIVLFAAAYKHVPLVEDNEIEGLRNNLFGTLTTAEVAQAAQVERFILVSTDKAVRPTNIMGASKRLAELAIQDLQTRSETTKFAMVRFGNVLGSSGSVIPLFQEQIAKGGPITLTHEKITRYFMTLSEASRLVLLAGAYADGGDVFVLDMGAPVNIRDLARRMVELSGLTVRDDENPLGDIEVETIGLRPGEKLYEELFLGKDILPTPHPKIMRAEENRLSQIEMARILKQVREVIATQDADALRYILQESVDGFQGVDVAAKVDGLR